MRKIAGVFACSVVVAVVATSVAWGQSLTLAKPEEVGLSSQRLEKIGQVFTQEIDKGNLPGAVIMVARKGGIAYYESFGFQDKSKETKMPKDAVFRIYSMTKPIVSVAAMILMEDGRLQLTDPVSKFLPEFKDLQVSVPKTDPYGKVIYTLTPAERQPTVQDLLRHTAGLAYGEITQNAAVKEAYVKAGVYKPDFDYNARDVTPEEEVQGLSKAPLVHQPGTAWEYSLAVDVLGRVVEKASGKRLADFLDERLFKPLKMVDSGFYVPQQNTQRLAEPLPKEPTTGTPNRLIDVSQPPKNDSGGAGGVSTAGDYLRFAQMMMNGGTLDGARILSRTTVKLMTSDHLGSFINQPMQPGELLLGTKGYTFGLGFAVRQADGVGGVPGSAGEFMWAGYAGTYFWVDPKEQVTAVLMTQAPSPNRAYFRKMVKQLVYQSIVD